MKSLMQDSEKKHLNENTPLVFSDDVEAFTRLYRQYYANLCDFTYWILYDKEASEDIVHEVYLHIWKHRKQIKTGESIRSYLYKSVKNKALNHIKHLNVERRWAEQSRNINLEKVYSPEEKLMAIELENKIAEALDALPKQRKRIFLMSRDHELSHKEIADILAISVKTVETQISRSLKSLREALDKYL